MGGDHVVELEDFDCDEDVAGDRLEQAGAGLEGRILRAEVAHNLVVELGGVGSELHGCESLGAGLGSNLGEEHVAPRAEHDEEVNEVVPFEVELEEVDPLVVPEHEPVVLSPEEGNVLVTREIRDEPELSIAEDELGLTKFQKNF